ncbi:MAG: hypothetical protein PHR68_04280, partial [Candidatus Gracilibacteria bacterium]|nr:hypothetical protein [Candidatus Gracilibacteria bacterium]
MGGDGNLGTKLTRGDLNKSNVPKKPGTETTTGTNFLVSETAENITGVLNENELLNKLLKKYPFICIENNKIYLKAESKEKEGKTNGMELAKFIINLFSNGFYIEGFFKKISDYNKYFIATIPDNYILGRQISKVQDYSKYPEIQIENNYEKALCNFFYDGELLNPDIFIAHLIKNKVYFGFDKENIEKGLAYIGAHKRTPSEYTVAKKMDPINGE